MKIENIATVEEILELVGDSLDGLAKRHAVGGMLTASSGELFDEAMSRVDALPEKSRTRIVRRLVFGAVMDFMQMGKELPGPKAAARRAADKYTSTEDQHPLLASTYRAIDHFKTLKPTKRSYPDFMERVATELTKLPDFSQDNFMAEAITWTSRYFYEKEFGPVEEEPQAG